MVFSTEICFLQACLLKSTGGTWSARYLLLVLKLALRVTGQWSLRSGGSLHGWKFQEVQYPGAVQESESPRFDGVTVGGIFCLSQFSSLVKIQLRWVDEHECLVTLWYLESRRPEAESRMQLQSAMHGHIGLAIWFAKPVSRQVMTNDNEQRAVKHLAARLAHVCIWICVDLDLRNGQKFPPSSGYADECDSYTDHVIGSWEKARGVGAHVVWEDAALGRALLKDCQSYQQGPTSILFPSISNAKWFQTYQRWPATWSCWDEGSVSQWVKGFKTPSKLLSCVMYHPKMPNHLGGTSLQHGLKERVNVSVLQASSHVFSYRILSLKSQHCRVHWLRRTCFESFERAIPSTAPRKHRHTPIIVSADHRSFEQGFKASRAAVFVLSKHLLVKAFSWFFLASGSFWIPWLYINIHIIYKSLFPKLYVQPWYKWHTSYVYTSVAIYFSFIAKAHVRQFQVPNC